ncbi:MAG: TIGR02453 family protein [Deltaproteobacteria bacterium]|nr:TIGR02453 family protein [Deltaproteobacteria bacterium]
MAANAITPSVFRFLRAIKRNNNRDWFTRNKERYIQEVRDPVCHFIADFGPKLERISRRLVADPRPVGGSMIRIYRDTRFSKDKSPYKSWVGIRFGHVDGKQVPSPGCYLHLEPGRVFFAGGMWHPETKALGAVRDAIVSHPERWKKIVGRRGFELSEGESLKRAPRGYDADHPFVDDLRRKGFMHSVSFTEKQACGKVFASELERVGRRAGPLMEFLAEAVGVRW